MAVGSVLPHALKCLSSVLTVLKSLAFIPSSPPAGIQRDLLSLLIRNSCCTSKTIQICFLFDIFYFSLCEKKKVWGFFLNNIYFVYNRCSWSSWGTKCDWGGWRLVYYDLGPSSKWWWITHLRYILSFFFLWWYSNRQKKQTPENRHHRIRV